MNGYAELIEGWRDKCRAAESERDALRAEVERLRKALGWMARTAMKADPCPVFCVCTEDDKGLSCEETLIRRAISEAGKE